MRPAAALCALLSLCTLPASGSYPKAQNIHWQSTNFKTVLLWEPKPSDEYTYTVEFSPVGGDRQRTPHCLRSSNTWCDLTSVLGDLKANYTADILSEPPRGATGDLIEPPYSTSPRFCPYKETDIGRPDFTVKTLDSDKSRITLHVTDPLTALFKDDVQLNIRDVFADDLQYLVTYQKSTSTGKKVHKSSRSVIEISGLDRGESYCFTVQAYIPSRRADKQLGEMSQPQCSAKELSFLEVYSVGVIAAGIFLILLLIGLVVAVATICNKRRKNAKAAGREKVPQDV